MINTKILNKNLTLVNSVKTIAMGAPVLKAKGLWLWLSSIRIECNYCNKIRYNNNHCGVPLWVMLKIWHWTSYSLRHCSNYNQNARPVHCFTTREKHCWNHLLWVVHDWKKQIKKEWFHPSLPQTIDDLTTKQQVLFNDLNELYNCIAKAYKMWCTQQHKNACRQKSLFFNSGLLTSLFSPRKVYLKIFSKDSSQKINFLSVLVQMQLIGMT